jgi:hypothetical protein
MYATAGGPALKRDVQDLRVDPPAALIKLTYLRGY